MTQHGRKRGALPAGNLALSIGFAAGPLVLLLVEGLLSLVGLPIEMTLSLTDRLISSILYEFCLPFAVAYSVLILAPWGRYIKTSPGNQILLGAANIVLLVFVVLRVTAISNPGSGIGLALGYISPFVVFPTQFLLWLGITWTAINSVVGLDANASEAIPGSRFGIISAVVITTGLALPLIWTASLFMGDESAYGRATRAAQVFAEKCVVAGEHIYLDRSDATGIYFEPNTGIHYSFSAGYPQQSPPGGVLASNGRLKFYEGKVAKRISGKPVEPYLRFTVQERMGVPVDHLLSEYGFFTTSLFNEDEIKMGFNGDETRIIDLRTNEIVATNSYVIRNKPKLYCGVRYGEVFNTSEFLTRALHLKPQSFTTR